ncbi:MAG: hypothetical protein FJ050_09350 [Cyanobacteria bacterium M_surface_7_m2_040]|nr:hypothetical protein [Cyanobacteria bacterium K_Offshore_0m_m2_072]MBM5808583.1 hypothetical protein [Cyanobacteria bacterium M_surface_9_m1_291]MBM5828235.1 hypothetical protein [Cyanobacteria bacterium M_surface_7_m2_040]
MGRLVITHSTYLDGLIPVLRRLASAPAIDTITPAVIGRVRGRSPQLQLRISTPIQGGHKLVARRGGSVQEVFVVTALSAAELEPLLAAALNRR